MEVANLLLQKNAPPDAAGKVTHVLSGWRLHGCISLQSELSLYLLTVSYSYDLTVLVCVQTGLTPLHVAAHYDNQKVALLLLKQGASPHAAAKVRAKVNLLKEVKWNESLYAPNRSDWLQVDLVSVACNYTVFSIVSWLDASSTLKASIKEEPLKSAEPQSLFNFPVE